MTVPLPYLPEAQSTVAAAAPTNTAGPEIRFYDNEVPAFAEAELERLYQCLMSTVARFDLYEAAPGASTYVVREGGQVTALFLFRRERTHVTVYNEQMPLAAADIRRFADAVFARYRAVSLISFYAIDTDAGAIGYPVQQRVCLEDIQMTLPMSGDAYLSALGKSTRANLLNGHRRLLRDFPSFRFEVYPGAAADEEQVRQIVAFNKARMSEKQQTSVHTERSTGQLYRLVQKYGLVGVATTGLGICAGVIALRVGSHYFLAVLAHDSRYNPYQLGKLCCYFSILDAIERGCKQYHFGWGRFDYKYKLLGQLTDLYQIELYRARPWMLLHAPRIAQLAGVAAFRRLKRRVATAERGTGRSDRCIRSAANVARAAKRLLRRTIKMFRGT
jgi:CelD/BcsL family acetyltransferase involved in cellulose biosynthesis